MVVISNQNEYKYDTKIGFGGSGNIYKSIDKDGRECAIKTITCDEYIGMSSGTLYELMMMETVDIPGIVKIKDYFITFCGDVKINIVLDYYQNNLLDYIIHNDIDTFSANNIFAEILKTVHNLELSKRYHGDLSSKNIMLDNNLKPVIIDLASSRKFRRNPINYPTMDVCPIEILTDDDVYTSKIDVWALGCLFYMMLSKDAIADGKSKEECVARINEVFDQGDNSFYDLASKVNYSFIGLKYYELIKMMINIDPKQRISISQLIEHDFIKQMDLSLNELSYNTKHYVPTYKYDTNILLTEERGKMIDFMMNLQTVFSVSLETVHIAIHIVDIVNKKIHIDHIVLFLMAFVISCKIVNDFNIRIVDINKILENFHKDPIDVKMHTVTIIDICSNGKWDIDPTNLYDYIHLLDNKYKNNMDFLLIVTTVISEIINYDIMTRIISLYIIIKYCNNDTVNDSFLKMLKSEMGSNMDFSLITNCTKVILYKFFMKYLSNNNSEEKKFITYSTKYCATFNSLAQNISYNDIMDNIVIYLV